MPTKSAFHKKKRYLNIYSMSEILKYRGLSGREPGRLQKNIADAEAEGVEKVLTMANVHNATTFELRQTLMKAGRFLEGSEEAKRINHEILMAAMVSILVEQKEKEDSKHAEELEKMRLGEVKEGKEERETLQEKLARQKAERKAEAIKRSQERQKAKEYFKQKEEQNSAGTEEKKKKTEEKIAALKNMNTEEVLADKEGSAEPGTHMPDPTVDEDDPFGLKFRPKFGGTAI